MKKIFVITLIAAVLTVQINAQSQTDNFDLVIENQTFNEGLVIENKTNVLIRNCNISNRDGKIGLKLSNCTNVKIENSIVSGVGNESMLSYDNTYSKVRKHIFLPLLQNQGILLADCKNVTITGCTITDIFGMGILVTGENRNTTTNILIENNRIAYVYADGIKFQVDGDQQNPTEVMPFRGGVIRNNKIHNVALGVSHLGFASHGMYLKAADILVEGNTIYNVFYGEGVSLRNAGTIRNNEIWNCARANIAFWQQTNTTGSSKTVTIENNRLRQEYAMDFPMRHALRPEQLHYLPKALITVTYARDGEYGWIDNYIIRNNECFVYSDYASDIPIIQFTNNPSEPDAATGKTPEIQVSGNLLIDNRRQTRYYRNVPQADDFWQSRAWSDYLDEFEYDWSGRLIQRAGKGRIVDFSYAGYGYGTEEIPELEVTAKVTDFGAVADDGNDDTKAFQAAIDYVGQSGGGVVYVPAGRYHFYTDGDKPFTPVIIGYSNVVIRGSGNGPDGSIIHLCNKADEKGWGADSFIIQTKAPDYERKPDIKIIEPGKKGQMHFKVESADWLEVGDYVRIELHNPMVEPNELLPHEKRLPDPLYTPPQGLERGATLQDTLKIRTDRLSRVVTYPLTPEERWIHYARYAPVQFVVEITNISDDNIVEIAQPLRFDLEKQWTPTIRPYPHLKNVGIENIRFESSWEGPYRHHGNWEMNYGWAAVIYNSVANGWIKDIVIKDYTLDINLSRCKNVTVSNVRVIGIPGHHGIVVGGGWDNLLIDCYIEAERTHSIGLSNSAAGNVFSNIVVVQGNGELDLHGGNFPMMNLFEQIENVRISSGGATYNMPHSGNGNVFWNIYAGISHRGQIRNELFDWCFYNYGAQREARGGSWATNCYRLYPGSVVVGVYDENGELEIDGSSDDRNDDWLYVEGLNKPNVYPASLYRAQLDKRLELEDRE